MVRLNLHIFRNSGRVYALGPTEDYIFEQSDQYHVNEINARRFARQQGYTIGHIIIV